MLVTPVLHGTCSIKSPIPQSGGQSYVPEGNDRPNRRGDVSSSNASRRLSLPVGTAPYITLVGIVLSISLAVYVVPPSPSRVTRAAKERNCQRTVILTSRKQTEDIRRNNRAVARSLSSCTTTELASRLAVTKAISCMTTIPLRRPIKRPLRMSRARP